MNKTKKPQKKIQIAASETQVILQETTVCGIGNKLHFSSFFKEVGSRGRRSSLNIGQGQGARPLQLQNFQK